MLSLKIIVDIFLAITITLILGRIIVSGLWFKELDVQSKIILLIAIFALVFLLSTTFSSLIFFIMNLLY